MNPEDGQPPEIATHVVSDIVENTTTAEYRKTHPLLSAQAIGIYGTILGCLLSSAYTMIQNHTDSLKVSAVQEYKISKFDPESFQKMQIDIHNIQEDIREIKEALKPNQRLALAK